MTDSAAVALGDPSGVAEARRTAVRLGGAIGFDVQDRGRLALVVTELSTNVLKHAGSGRLVLNAGCAAGLPCCQVVAIDAGPGFDLSRCLRDGHSTSGSPGTGLGAITRLADSFDAHTQPSRGSVLFAEIRAGRRPPPGEGLLLAAITVPKEGELECGDAWAQRTIDGRVLVLVADGLGHGPQAAIASRLAVREFEDAPVCEPASLVERIHAALRPTRGATVAVAVVDPTARQVRYAGIGNIGAAIVGGDRPARYMVSHNGTAGHQVLRIQEFTYPWPEASLLVMASDGLSTRWNLAAYPGLGSRHPAVVAGVLYRDFGRARDDVTVVVGELRPGRAASELP